jgi:dolichyl-diphosphooligosaccharide--protein glycosyltransferase
MNSYFNIISNTNINPDGTTLSDTYYLSGPDPYYNMRLVDTTIQNGRFPYYSSSDPLLAYPIGRSGQRAPLLVMSAIGFSKLLTPFMSETDAVGYAMQFVPALYGALLVFPVYFIGKILFGKKAGLVAALLIALIPIHISSGHGSAYALFDHDSFNLLIYFMTFLFLIKSIKEKETIRRILYALLAGVSLAALSMVWVEAQYLYTIIAIYVVIQLIFDLFTNKVEEGFVISVVTAFFTGVLLSLPITSESGTLLGLPFFLALGVAIFGGLCIVFKRKQIPWVISYPLVGGLGVAILGFLYVVYHYSTIFSAFTPLNSIAKIIYGTGIYGMKVDKTIAEAGTYNISRTVMSYGPALYWLAWAGFVLLIYQYVKQKGRRDYLMILTLFVINIWLTSTAGRFLNDMVPLIALLSGWIIWFLLSNIDYKQMARNIRNAGGGFRGIRKGVRIYHILGVLFVAFLILIPNGYLALDAAVPSAVTKNGTSNMKSDFFGQNHSNAFGSSSFKEQYWVAAYAWLNKQDKNIIDPVKRPAYISWWDYGFYEVAVGGHPTVADNFQDGIPTAANFHVAKSEKEGIAVWIIRLLEGNKKDNNGGAFSDSVITALQKNLGNNNTTKITSWMLNPNLSPSYKKGIGVEYDENLSKKIPVGEQYPANAYYHDIVQLLNDTLTDEQITWLYHDLQQATGYSIRYYGVEGYDEQIFNIFAFLADKSNILTAVNTAGKQYYNPEDDFIQLSYKGYTVNTDGTRGSNGSWTAQQLNDMTAAQRKYIAITGTEPAYKKDYFNTMFYRVFIGYPVQQDSSGNYQIPSKQVPCYTMKHFVPVYVSPYPDPYAQSRHAVVIAKYYEGAFFNGSISCNNTPLPYVSVAILDEFGLPHDNTFTDENGSFNLLAPGGNITLLFSYANEVLLKQITFNNTNNTLYSPVTDAEAMRLNGSKYSRDFNISVNLSTQEGFVYLDNNNNNSYEPGIDTPLSGVTVKLNDYYFGRQIQPVQTDLQGHYIFHNLYPGKYNISAIENEYTLLNKEPINIVPGNNSYNILKPKLAEAKGVVYTDNNNDAKYTTGEESSDVQIQLTYTKFDGTQKPVTNLTTGMEGSYSFSSLIPGEYTLNATKQNTSTGHLIYLTEQTVTLTANKTSWVNISLTYAPVIVSGYTTNNTNKIANIPVSFTPDNSVKNNTAIQNSITSDAQGYFTAKLIPGTYNVTVQKTDGTTIVYTFTGKMGVSIAEGTAFYIIDVTKESVTVSGSTKYNGVGKANTTILFSKDSQIANNTAVTKSVKTDINGNYATELTPGSYNASVKQVVNESGQNITYIGTDHITLNKGEPPRILDIVLTREESP